VATETLSQRADRLQREARAVLDELGLLPLLAGYGKPQTVGSLALGVMACRDIDIDVETEGEIHDDDVWEVARTLLQCEDVRLISLADERSGSNPARVPSMYLGVRVCLDGAEIWKIDVRFVCAGDAVAASHVAELQGMLTLRSRVTILEIKDAVLGRPEYGHDVSGLDIYRAVLSDGVADVEGFDAWLARSRDPAWRAR